MSSFLTAIAPALISGAFGLFGGGGGRSSSQQHFDYAAADWQRRTGMKDLRDARRFNARDLAEGARHAASEFGFNPLTMLGLGGGQPPAAPGSPFVQNSQGAPIQSREMRAALATGISDFLETQATDDEKNRRQAERQRETTERVQEIEREEQESLERATSDNPVHMAMRRMSVNPKAPFGRAPVPSPETAAPGAFGYVRGRTMAGNAIYLDAVLAKKLKFQRGDIWTGDDDEQYGADVAGQIATAAEMAQVAAQGSYPTDANTLQEAEQASQAQRDRFNENQTKQREKDDQKTKNKEKYSKRKRR